MVDKYPADSEILGRLDERTLAIQESLRIFREEISALRSDQMRQYAELSSEIQKSNSSISSKFDSFQEDFDDKIKSLKAEIEEKYVSIDRYSPVEKLVYGIVGIALTAIVTGLLALVIKN